MLSQKEGEAPAPQLLVLLLFSCFFRHAIKQGMDLGLGLDHRRLLGPFQDAESRTRI